MALDQSALLGLLGELKLTDVSDQIRVATESLYQELIDAEAVAFIGAAPLERTPDRVTQRNGTRPRTLTTTAGELELRIPKLRQGSFFPSLLERRRRIDQALFAVVMEAYVHGVSSRKVDDLVKALGADTGISKSEVSRICANLDEDVAAFRDRPLADTAYPYMFLDATYCKARVDWRVVSQAVVIAVGVAADGRREVLGFDVGSRTPGMTCSPSPGPYRALAPDLVHQPAGAAEQGGQTPHRRGRHLPEPRRATPPRRARPDRTARRMGRRLPPLLQRTLHGPPDRRNRGGGDPRTDRGIINQLTSHGVEKLHHSAGHQPCGGTKGLSTLLRLGESLALRGPEYLSARTPTNAEKGTIMMWGYGYEGWGWMWLIGGLVLIGIVVLVVVLVRNSAASTAKTTASAPQQILADRYARGELTTQEYRERLEILGGKP